MTNNKTEVEIMKNWQGNVERPLVTIFVVTFNHAKFIEQAMESFLVQETTFPFEIVIHDDASTDGTADIIREYAARYPTIIRPIYQKENQYSQGIRVMNLIFNLIFPQMKGKYVAICEGDDYWKGVTKLQQQADFLENNPAYSLCYHNSIVVDDDDKIISEIRNTEPQDYTQESMLLGETFILTNTIMFRAFPLKSLKEYGQRYKDVFNGDMVLVHLAGLMGKCKYMEEVEYAAYRVHNGGVWSGINELGKIDNLYKSKRALQQSLTSFPSLAEKMDETIRANFAVSLTRILLAKDFKNYQKLIDFIYKDYDLHLLNILSAHVKYIVSRLTARVPLVKQQA